MTYLTFTSYYNTDSGSYKSCSYEACGNRSAYGSQWWYWKNETGTDVTIEYSILHKPLSTDTSYSCILYRCNSRTTGSDSATKLKTIGSTTESWKTYTGTITIPAGKWLWFFNQNSSWAKIEYMRFVY